MKLQLSRRNLKKQALRQILNNICKKYFFEANGVFSVGLFTVCVFSIVYTHSNLLLGEAANLRAKGVCLAYMTLVSKFANKA